MNPNMLKKLRSLAKSETGNGKNNVSQNKETNSNSKISNNQPTQQHQHISSSISSQTSEHGNRPINNRNSNQSIAQQQYVNNNTNNYVSSCSLAMSSNSSKQNRNMSRNLKITNTASSSGGGSSTNNVISSISAAPYHQSNYTTSNLFSSKVRNSKSRVTDFNSNDGTSRRRHRDLSQNNRPTGVVISKDASITLVDRIADSDHPIITEKVIKELDRRNMSTLINTVFNPEPFLKPSLRDHVHLLDRRVNANKIVDYLASFMTTYYDLQRDRNPFCEWRETMDERLWDSFSYVIPSLCRQVIDEALKQEPIVLTLGPDVILFGDIHGNFNDMYYIYKNFISAKRYVNYKFVFLGDYVDRGPKSIEVILLLFSLKLTDPKRYILLRGNHEVSKVNTKYGFRSLVDHLYGDTFITDSTVLPTLIYECINQAFNHLPLAAVIRFRSQKGIFCCHGGIPNEKYNSDRPWTIEDLNRLNDRFKPHKLVPREKSPAGQSALNEILWNDPIAPPTSLLNNDRHRSSGGGASNKLFYKNRKRGGHCSKFTEKAIDRFLSSNNLRMVIRGHQFRLCKDRGYFYHFSNQVLTVFSSSNYCGNEINTTGYVHVTDDHCQASILRTTEESKQYHNFNHFELIMENNKVVEVVF